MDIYQNKDFTLSQRKAVQFGEYPVSKSVNTGKSIFDSSNGLISRANVEFGEYEKTTNEIGIDSEYNPSDIDILQGTNSGDNLLDIQSLTNNSNENIVSSFEVLKTNNYIGKDNAQFEEYPTTFKINNDESSYNPFYNAEKSSEDYINPNIISENLKTNDYQKTDSNINLGTK